ncbi:cytochrome b562 [Haloferula sp. BvORR071]|uniref:cytochrome b562 n=1 Tax=Haloferula sp. BvORR071 TaxID=1396141 RepID=UPI0005551E5A|nr:cytochrome b562 [Haloferula sp. BvORR071]
MKKLIFPAILLVATVFGPVRAGAEEKDTPLAKEMEKLNDVYKSFKKETDSAKGAASAREAQGFVLKGITMTPEMLEKMPAGEEKEKALAKYKAQMGKLYVSLCEVESAYLAKDMPAVAKLVDTLKGQKKEGHEAFMEEEK